MIVELAQAHPYAFSTGYYSGRIWVNGVSMNRVYFGNFTSAHLFCDMNTDQLMLCSRAASDGPNSILNEGKYDMLNFIWFKGSEGLYEPTSTEGKFRLSSIFYINLIASRSIMCAQRIH